MASFTRKAIMEAFVVLLNEKPLNKITIKGISSRPAESTAIRFIITFRMFRI